MPPAKWSIENAAFAASRAARRDSIACISAGSGSPADSFSHHGGTSARPLSSGCLSAAQDMAALLQRRHVVDDPDANMHDHVTHEPAPMLFLRLGIMRRPRATVVAESCADREGFDEFVSCHFF